MNPYTLQSQLRVDDTITFRPRFSTQVVDGRVIAIKFNDGPLFGDGDAVSKVYVKYYAKDGNETVTDWVRPRRIYHINNELFQSKPVFTPGPRCTRPPYGWFCTRGQDHDGPCAAWPEGTL